VSFNVTDYLAQQLQAAAPDAEWNASGVDRAYELARILERNGIRDLGRLQLEKLEVTSTPAAAWLAPTVTTEYRFLYDGRPIGYMGTPHEPARADWLEPGLRAAWSAEGKGAVGYHVHPGKFGGFALVPSWGSTSDAATVRNALLFLGTFVVTAGLPAAGISAAGAIGSAVVPATFAVQYPTLTTLIGNVALQTAMNGGNIAAAVKSAVMSLAGAQAGAFTGGAVLDSTNIELLSKMAASATSAFVQGKDVKTAVQNTLLMTAPGALAEGFEAMFDDYDPAFDAVIADAMTDPSASYFDPVYDAPVFTDPGASYFDPVYDAPGAVDPSAAPIPVMDPNEGISFNVEYGTPAVSISATGGPAEGLFPTVNVSSPIPTVDTNASTPSTFDLSNIVQSVTSVVAQGLQLARMFQGITNPQARAVQANGAVRAASDNGYVQTRAPNGQVSSAKPPVGVAQATVTGSWIVNNGDGTYDLIDGMGNRTTNRYPTTAPGVSSFGSLSQQNMLLLGAAGLGLLLLLRKG
jgi:hypothetical protein